MPIVKKSDYTAPFFLPGGHAQTLFPVLFRKVELVEPARERLELEDGDFLDLDWYCHDSERLVILSHGLEGNSKRAYIKGMARAFLRRGWDALAWNFRGCSGEPNRLLRTYHSGASEDLDAVVRRALSIGRYRELALVGFSVGGNITLKLLGEMGEDAPQQIRAAVVFSVPCDLKSAAEVLASPRNRGYMRYFLKPLQDKIRQKTKSHPGQITDDGFEQIRTFREFDERYTAPLNGFRNAEQYWSESSSRSFLGRIRVPTLIVNAHNDPFLGKACYPYEEAETSEWVHLEVTRSGGHVGFARFGKNGEYWSEQRAAEFVSVHRR